MIRQILAPLVFACVTACSPGGGSSSSNKSGSPSPSAASATPAATPVATTPSAGTAGPQTISATSLATPNLMTKASAGTTCTTVSFTVTTNGQPDSAVAVTFASVSSSGATDVGSMQAPTETTNAQGVATDTYCAGSSAGTFDVTATVGSTTANSAPITVTSQATYTFAFSNSDLPVVAPSATATASASGSTSTTAASGGGSTASASASGSSLGTIYMNLFDSGPNDCTNLYFQLDQSGSGLAGTTVEFKTQLSFPKGAKLATRPNPVQTATDPSTGNLYAFVNAVSNASGQFTVPVCAGVQLGSLLVSATYTSSGGTAFTVNSPVIVIQSGVTNWLDMTLTYAQPDGYTLAGYLNTNNIPPHQFTVNLGSTGNGEAIDTYSIFAASETGQVDLINGGAINPATSTAQFTVNAINLQDSRPFPVYNYPAGPAQTVCDVETLASGTADVPYPQLAMNWRSTLVYGVRGQEYFHDAYGDGVYHPGCTGFWDKNQNGIFDAGDVITHDPFGDGTLHNNCDWFIDLPGPFIDVNENGSFDTGEDISIGDSYVAPNGQWDEDTTVWKYVYAPIYMGASLYSLSHSTITHGNIPSFNDPLGLPYYMNLTATGLAGPSYPSTFNTNTNTNNLYLWGGLTGINTNTMFGVSNGSYGGAWFYFFAQSVCGTPMPGGTPLNVTFTPLNSATFGPRPPLAHFFVQPLDFIRAPSMQLLATATGASGASAPGGSSATINFDIAGHPAAAAAYPIMFRIEVPACTNQCTGAIASLSYACDNESYDVTLQTDTAFSTQVMQVPPSGTCNCVNGATATAGVCSCAPGYTFTNASCVASGT